MELSEHDRAELTDIGWHWDGAYWIGHDGESFTAKRRGTDHVVRAKSAPELRQEIRKDYFAWLAEIREESMSL